MCSAHPTGVTLRYTITKRLYVRTDITFATHINTLLFDKSALTAITQIKEKNYLQFFKNYKGEVLLVGINYSKDTKTHQCIIEKVMNG